MVAAKSYYFGVGGGVQSFIKAIQYDNLFDVNHAHKTTEDVTHMVTGILACLNLEHMFDPQLSNSACSTCQGNTTTQVLLSCHKAHANLFLRLLNRHKAHANLLLRLLNSFVVQLYTSLKESRPVLLLPHEHAHHSQHGRVRTASVRRS
eukprot:scaffold60803_cov20-Tisochrysis_lutea.AAC.2